VAGKRKGSDDDRALWPETHRVIEAISPTFVVCENVTGIISMELDAVLSDLEALHYATETFVIPACAKNAWHQRDRVWIIAYPYEFSKQHDSGSIEFDHHQKWDDKAQKQNQFQQFGADKPTGNAADPPAQGFQDRAEQPMARPKTTAQSQRLHSLHADPNSKRSRKNGKINQAKFLDQNGDQWRAYANQSSITSPSWWETEPPLGRVVHGIPGGVAGRLKYPKDTNKKIKGLGNAIVPALAYEFFQIIQKVYDQHSP
jgi:DNA (cytosine-5)-methyltransferase 1